MPDSPVRILIVDDDPMVRMSMQFVLDELGYRVRSAAEGFAALREIREEMSDILLTDLNMPGMSGSSC
jgi:CheY-like chemotaxis protein